MKILFFVLFIFLVVSCSSNKEQKTLTKKAELYYGHGTDYLIAKKYSKALEFLLKASELEPKNSKVINNLGMAYYFKNQHSTAIELLKKSIKLDPKNSDAKNNLASIYFDLKQYDKAKELYLQVKNDLIYEHQYRTYYNLALIAERKGNYQRMITLLENSAKEREDYCPAYLKLGKFYLNQQRYSQAIKNFRTGSGGVCYKHPNATYFLGLSWEKISETQKAINKYMEVISTFPKSDFSKLARRRLEILTKNDPILDLRLKKHDTSLKTKVDSLEF